MQQYQLVTTGTAIVYHESMSGYSEPFSPQLLQSSGEQGLKLALV
jgi:hypothetical protein